MPLLDRKGGSDLTRSLQQHFRLATLASLILLPACTCQPPLRLRLGMMLHAGCSPLLLAHEQRLFERHGLDVELHLFGSQADAKAHWKREKFDLICTNLAELLTLPADYKVLLVPDVSRGADVLIARKDAGTDLPSLKGARIGVSPISMGDLLLTAALRRHTLAREDFTVLPEEAPDLREALQKSEIQMAIAAPPYSLEILKIPETTVIFRSSELPRTIIDTIAAHADRLQKAPELPQLLEGVWQDTLQLMQDEPESSLNFLTQKTTIPVPTFQQDYQFLNLDEQADYLGPDGRLPALIEELQTMLLQSGSLTTRRDAPQFLLIPTTR